MLGQKSVVAPFSIWVRNEIEGVTYFPHAQNPRFPRAQNPRTLYSGARDSQRIPLCRRYDRPLARG
jgi:hypothetical protein